MPSFVNKSALSLCIFLFAVVSAHSQTQEDFDKKLTDIYTVNTTDKKKALALAKELYNAAERKKDLQTITNYYMLKNLFENTRTALAKTCADKADRLTRESVGKEVPKADYGSDSMNLWYNTLYPGLYETKDPGNAKKALAFLDQYSSFRSFANYTGIAYAFERNGDFENAKKYYIHALTLTGNEKTEHVSYLYYILFLTKSGDYLKAEELIKKIEGLALTATQDIIKMSYPTKPYQRIHSIIIISAIMNLM
jgi:tetratricopeptide (TPR) repeat protein